MGYVINMPKLEQGMQQGLLLEWTVSVGDAVEEGDVLAEIESEKTVSEITAREGGVLRRLYLEEGDSAAPGSPLGVVAGASESISSLVADIDRESVAVAEGEASPSEAGAAAEADADTTPDEGEAAAAPASVSGGSGRVSPRARKLAAERGVDVDGVEGSGPGGAVVEADVQAAAAGGATGEPADAEPPRATPRAKRRAAEEGVDLASVSGSGPKGAVTADDVEAALGGGAPAPDQATAESAQEPVVDARSDGLPPAAETYELSGMRRTIAERLGQSDREAVHVTVSRVVDAEALLRATDIADAHLDLDVSMTDLLLLAVSATLSEHPSFNARFEDETVHRYDVQNVGVAVDIDRGLVTPVLRGVESKSLAELVSDRRDVTDRVIDGEFDRSDLSGGTFTVSNLGVFGVESFDPVINPPQVAILGVTSLRERPVQADGEVAFRRHIGFDLSFDHRIVDGADAARALDTLATHVRDPWSLLLDRT